MEEYKYESMGFDKHQFKSEENRLLVPKINVSQPTHLEVGDISKKDLQTSQKIREMDKALHDLKSNLEKDRDFDALRKDFSLWTKNHLQEVHAGRVVFPKISHFHKGPADYKIHQMYGFSKMYRLQSENVQLITEEQEKQFHRINSEFRVLENKLFASEEYHVLVTDFIKELVSFSTKISEDEGEDDVQRKMFFHNIQTLYFGWSPDITERISISNKLLIVAEANKNEFIRGQFGQKMNGELVYSMSWGAESLVDDILQTFYNLEVKDKLNVIHQLVTIASMSAGEGTQSRNGFLRSQKIIENIFGTEKSPIVKYFAKISLEKIAQEEKNPSIGVLTYEGNVNAGRLVEGVNKDIDNDSKWIKSKIVLPDKFLHHKAYFVSSDCIALLDSANIPSAFINKNRHEVEAETYDSVLTAEQLANIKSVVDNAIKNNQSIDMSSVLLFLESNNIDIHTVFPKAQMSDIKKYLNLAKEINRIENNVVQIRNAAAREASELYYEEIQKIFNFVDDNEKKFFEGFEKSREDYAKMKEDGYEDGMVNIIEYISMSRISRRRMKNKLPELGMDVSHMQQEPHLNTAQAEVEKRFSSLQDANQKRWNKIKKLDFSDEESYVEELYSEIDMMPQAGFDIDSLKSFIDMHKKKMSKHEVTVLKYNHIDDDSNLTPFDDDISELVRFLHRPDILFYINEDLGVELQTLSLREQINFLNFIAEENNETFDRLRGILKKDSIEVKSFLKSFLSTSGDKKFGEKILSIGENYEQEISAQIFQKYGELVDAADGVEKYLSEQFGDADPAITKQVVENLLMRGKALLSAFADSDDITPQRALDKLENIVAEVELFKESFKTVRKSGDEISLTELGVVQFHILTGPELASKKDVVARMQKIYMENYAAEKFSDAFRNVLRKSLEKNLANPQTRFYVLYHKGKIVAFNSFTPQDDGTVHFANFNVDKKYTDAQLGNAMMEASLAKEIAQATIVAEAVPDAPITDTYIRKYGFKNVGEVDIGGVRLFSLRREQTKKS